MLILFKPQLGGFDGGGIAGGYVIPTDRKKQRNKRSILRKPIAKAAKPTPQAVVELVKDHAVDELTDQLSALSTAAEITVLKGAEALLVAELERAALLQEQDAKKAAEAERGRQALKLLSQSLEEAMRRLVIDADELWDIFDILDGDAMRALDVHSYTSRKKRKRPFSKR